MSQKLRNVDIIFQEHMAELIKFSIYLQGEPLDFMNNSGKVRMVNAITSKIL